MLGVLCPPVRKATTRRRVSECFVRDCDGLTESIITSHLYVLMSAGFFHTIILLIYSLGGHQPFWGEAWYKDISVNNGQQTF
jgi:hypothetical protein